MKSCLHTDSLRDAHRIIHNSWKGEPLRCPSAGEQIYKSGIVHKEETYLGYDIALAKMNESQKHAYSEISQEQKQQTRGCDSSLMKD